MNSTTRTRVVIIILLVVVCASVFFACEWRQCLRETRVLSDKNMQNEKIIAFTSLFINSVFNTGTVSFEDRFKMENAVREINNKEIMVQWEKFTSSKNQAESQENAKKLFGLLVDNFRK
jgi:hypothetical protein